MPPYVCVYTRFLITEKELNRYRIAAAAVRAYYDNNDNERTSNYNRSLINAIVRMVVHGVHRVFKSRARAEKTPGR